MIHPYSHYLARAARRYPDRVAVIDGETKISYTTLNERASRLAQALLALGLRYGDRVAILQGNTHSYPVAVCGVARAGGVVVPLLGILTEADHAFMVEDSQARILISLSPAMGHRARALKERLLGVEHAIAPGGGEAVVNFEDLLAAHEPKNPCIQGREGDLAQILYTSGTTGRPKGVMHSYAGTAAAMGAWVFGVGIDHEDRLLGHFALSHFGGRVMDSSWCVGGTLVILPRPEVGSILEAIQRHRITVLLMIPTLMQMVVNHPDIQSYDLSSLRIVLYAAAPASPTLVRRAFDIFGPILVTGFGQTEAYGMNTFLSAAEHREALEKGLRRLASVGREATALVQVRLLDEEGKDVPPGRVGEICLRAPWVMQGYWQQPELTAQAIVDGWLHTRDLGLTDEEGYIYLTDRKEDLIITGGFNVYPKEVEDVIASHPAVSECCVIGVPDPKWGEAVKAVVVVEETRKVSGEELVSFCRERLTAFKVPKSVDLVPSLPKTAVGKILRRTVKAAYWRGHDTEIHGAQ